MIQLNHRKRYNLTFVQKGDNDMSMMNSFIKGRMELWAIDAKYWERSQFYYKVYGELEGIRSALIWFSNCSDSEFQEALQQLTTYRELLDTWYYRV